MPSRRTAASIPAVIRELLFATAAASADRDQPRRALSTNVTKKRSVVFLVSDFLDVALVDDPAVRMLGRKHDVSHLSSTIPRELEMRTWASWQSSADERSHRLRRHEQQTAAGRICEHVPSPAHGAAPGPGAHEDRQRRLFTDRPFVPSLMALLTRGRAAHKRLMVALLLMRHWDPRPSPLRLTRERGRRARPHDDNDRRSGVPHRLRRCRSGVPGRRSHDRAHVGDL